MSAAELAALRDQVDVQARRIDALFAAMAACAEAAGLPVPAGLEPPPRDRHGLHLAALTRT